MSIVFKSLSSGSCGNCYFLASTDSQGRVQAGVAIDTGVSVRRLKEELRRHGYSPDDIHAVLLTHDHMDHIRSLGSWCKRLSKPVWTSGVLHSCLAGRTISGEDFIACSRVLGEGDWNEVVPGHVKVRYFVVPHDATQTVGYAIVIDSYRFVIMTDIGAMTPEALSWASHAQTVVIESNYDPVMLKNGPYPPELQERIRNGFGHLSNQECAMAVAEFAHPGLRNVFLCHLSEHNNTPELARDCTRPVLDPAVRLVPLPRECPSVWFNLD